MISAAAPAANGTQAEPVECVLPAARDARLIPYLLIAVGALSAALLTGRPALVGVAVPFLLAVALGSRARGPVRVWTRTHIDAEQVLEGEVVRGRIEMWWPGTFDARVALHRAHGAPLEGGRTTLSWELPSAAGGAALDFALRTNRWGRRPAGEVWLRLTTPGGLLVWSGRVAKMQSLRVLPAGERLNRLLNPPQARAVLGAHRSPRQGEGSEFAALRPYLSGDRLRDLNWRASARHRRPYVNRHHQEVSGDLVIVVDAFGDGSAGSDLAIARAARAGWALASAHLRANDRVGLVVPGGGTRWLPPAGGRRARHALLEALLAVGDDSVEASERRSRAEDPPRVNLPPAAQIVVLTDLHDGRMPAMIQRWRARGRAVAVLIVGSGAADREDGGVSRRLARRVWEMEVEGRRRQIVALGVPVVAVGIEGSVGPAITALRRIGRASSMRALR